MSFNKEWDKFQKEVYANAKDKGFWDDDRNDGELICLMHAELSEALESLRKGSPPDEKCPAFTNLEVEMADVVIRIMDYAEARGLRLPEAMAAKHAYNKTRPRKHRKKVLNV